MTATPPTSGERTAGLTCHVLDLTCGLPAGNVGLQLSRRDGARPRLLMSRTTNADGRTDEPLLDRSELEPGLYELAFAVGDHFTRAADPGEVQSVPYLDVVPIHFGVAPGVDRLHVALLVTPWSYTTYRGS